MAVRIDVPGIGVVEAEGVASEETLQRIAAALERSSAGLTKDQKDQAKATKESTKALKENTTGWVAAGDAFTQSLKNMALTATSVAAKFFANYESIAANPIKAGQSLLNTAIDLTADLAGGLAKSIPFVGDFAKGLVDATAALAKLANDAFADQLQKNVDALRIYAKSGVSFSGGMQDMQNMATMAGLGLKEFSEVVNKNKTELNKLGLSGGEAAERLARTMGAAATTIGKSGQNLRSELIKMGFMYDDQGEIFTAFMAQQQAAGKLRVMTDKEVAQGAREYATNLKVISDLTGKDAKKLLERANAEMLRGSLQNKLVGDQKTAFASASALISDKSKAAGDALTQYLTFGTITDPAVAANQELANMVRSVGDEVLKGNKNITSYTQEQMALTVNRINTSGRDFAAATDAALVAKVPGLVSSIAQVSNEFVQAFGSATPDPKAAEKSAAASEDQASKVNKLGDVTAQLYDATKRQQVLIESKLNPNLETYVGLLEKANNAAITLLNKVLGIGGGGSTGKPFATPGTAGFPQLSQNPMIPPVSGPGIKKYADGGRLGAGKLGIAGEAGPELISGPSTILSQASTEQLIVALDAMREMKGERLGRNDFEWNVNMEQKRLATLKDRTSAFGGLDISALESELSKRPEVEGPMAKARAAMMEGEDQPTKWPGKEAADQTVALLSELVTAMKQNVSQTARVAMNTN